MRAALAIFIFLVMGVIAYYAYTGQVSTSNTDNDPSGDTNENAIARQTFKELIADKPELYVAERIFTIQSSKEWDGNVRKKVNTKTYPIKNTYPRMLLLEALNAAEDDGVVSNWDYVDENTFKLIINDNWKEFKVDVAKQKYQAFKNQ
jgi:hypothetical protein